MVTYAIGDVHGCLGPLTELLDHIRSHAAGRPHRLVFLGDYIDRGEDSAGVIRLVRAEQAKAPDHVICLKGNHEDMLLTAAADPTAVRWWLANGGAATLDSFAVDRIAKLPPDVLDWMAGLPVVYEDARHCYVHAGLNPARGRHDQTDHDRLWIRDEFLQANHDFGKYVVHGHTPVRTGRPDVRPHRVDLDTGAVYGGPLTAAVLSEDEDRPTGFLQALG